MTDKEKQKMLLEERYATVRVQVRDAYEKCQIMLLHKQENETSLKQLENKKHFFNKKKVQKSIDEIIEDNQDNETKIAEIKEYLQGLSDEMTSLEKQLGDRAEIYYGRDPEWWVRR